MPPDRELYDVPSFVKGVETLGWDSLENLVCRVPWQVEITICLGDMDWFSMDGCAEWASAASLSRLELEIEAARKAVQSQAESQFPRGTVTVARWTDLYNQTDFDAEFLLAKDKSAWKDLRLIGESTQMYLKQWGYEDIARRMEVPSSAMEAFIREDCMRTAAQYRVEANVIQATGALQAWAERVPSPQWPLRISNYDGAGLPPTLFLLDSEGQ